MCSRGFLPVTGNPPNSTGVGFVRPSHGRFINSTVAPSPVVALPDFSALKHEDEGKLPRNLFDLSPRTRNESFGFVFDGTLIVPEAGRYTFFLDSDLSCA